MCERTMTRSLDCQTGERCGTLVANVVDQLKTWELTMHLYAAVYTMHLLLHV
jgi:hypothetical protein